MTRRRDALRFLGVGAAGGLITAQGLPLRAMGKAPAVVKRRRPNILMIVTDQERSWRDLPPDLPLPRRHAFAEKAIMFDDYHVNAMACGPSRAVIYTGRHIQQTGIYDNPGMAPGRKDLDPEKTPTVGQMLRDLGYHTAYHGKWHLSTRTANERPALARFGFDEYEAITPRGDSEGEAHGGARHDARCARLAEQWLRVRAARVAEEKPWFLTVNFVNPHDIMYFNATGEQQKFLPEPFRSEIAAAPKGAPYDEDLGYDLPPSFSDDLASKPQAHRSFVEDGRYFYGPIPIADEPAWRRYQNYYFNCLRDVDKQVGLVLDALGASGLSDNTIVIFTSDHGELAGAHGQRLKGPFIYRENFGVPLLIRHPDVRHGARSRSLVSALDLAPTILAMAGGEVSLPGYDFSDVIAAPQRKGMRDREAGGILFTCSATHCSNPDKKKQFIAKLFDKSASEPPPDRRFPEDFVQFELRSFLRGIYDGRYRFGRYFRPGDHHMPRDWDTLTARNDLELYDIEADPHAVNNLAHRPDGHRKLILALNEKLNRLLDREAGGDDGGYMPGDHRLWRT